jgi:hypothetical protein
LPLRLRLSGRLMRISERVDGFAGRHTDKC